MAIKDKNTLKSEMQGYIKGNNQGLITGDGDQSIRTDSIDSSFNLVTDINKLSQQLPWVATENYPVGVYVFYNDALYKSLQSGVNNPPDTSPTFWYALPTGATDTNGLTNVSTVDGATATDAFNWLNSNKIESVLEGSNINVQVIDGKTISISSTPSASAGTTSSLFLTADDLILTSGTYFFADDESKGTVATTQQDVNLSAGVKAFYAKDFVTATPLVDTPFPTGDYNAVLSSLVASAGSNIEYTIEVYLTDIDGVPVNPNFTNPIGIGDLGQEMLAVMNSGFFTPSLGTSNVLLNAKLSESFTVSTTNRVRFHVSCERANTGGGSNFYSLLSGSDHQSFIQIPVVSKASTVIDDSASGSGGLLSDRLDLLKSEIDSISGGYVYSGVAYVDSGATLPGVLGDSSKPFADIKSAIDSVPALGFAVIECLGNAPVWGSGLINASGKSIYIDARGKELSVNSQIFENTGDCIVTVRANNTTLTGDGSFRFFNNSAGTGKLNFDLDGTYKSTNIITLAGGDLSIKANRLELYTLSLVFLNTDTLRVRVNEGINNTKFAFSNSLVDIYSQGNFTAQNPIIDTCAQDSIISGRFMVTGQVLATNFDGLLMTKVVAYCANEFVGTGQNSDMTDVTVFCDRKFSNSTNTNMRLYKVVCKAEMINILSNEYVISLEDSTLLDCTFDINGFNNNNYNGVLWSGTNNRVADTTWLLPKETSTMYGLNAGASYSDESGNFRYPMRNVTVPVGTEKFRATDINGDYVDIELNNLPSGGGVDNTVEWSFVKTGAINTVVALNTHSSFTSATGFFVGTGNNYELIGFKLNSGSGAAASAGDLKVKMMYGENNSGTQHTVGTGTLLKEETLLTSVGAVATTFNVSAEKGFTAVPLVADKVYFLDVSTIGGWSFTDLEVIAIIKKN